MERSEDAKRKAEEMTFEDYWAEVEKQKVLPNTAIQQRPSSLSDGTKKKLMRMLPNETIEILSTVIDEINRGAVESIDKLVRRRL